MWPLHSNETPPYISFKLLHPYEERRRISQKIASSFPDRVPIILEPQRGEPQCFRVKYLSPAEIPVSKFIAEVRRTAELTPDQGITFFFDGQIPRMYWSMRDIYNQNGDDDGFLYVVYCRESCFG